MEHISSWSVIKYYKGKQRSLLEATREVDLEVNAERTKYTV
jgi:hypothetical protein